MRYFQGIIRGEALITTEDRSNARDFENSEDAHLVRQLLQVIFPTVNLLCTDGKDTDGSWDTTYIYIGENVISMTMQFTPPQESK